MCPDVLSMCFAALMALFSERSRKFCPSADGDRFRRLFDLFGLCNPVVVSFLLLGDAQSGDEHNLNAKECDIGSDRDREKLPAWFRVDYLQERKRTHILERRRWSCSGAALHCFSCLVPGVCVSVCKTVTVCKRQNSFINTSDDSASLNVDWSGNCSADQDFGECHDSVRIWKS